MLKSPLQRELVAASVALGITFAGASQGRADPAPPPSASAQAPQVDGRGLAPAALSESVAELKKDVTALGGSVGLSVVAVRALRDFDGHVRAGSELIV